MTLRNTSVISLSVIPAPPARGAVFMSDAPPRLVRRTNGDRSTTSTAAGSRAVILGLEPGLDLALDPADGDR